MSVIRPLLFFFVAPFVGASGRRALARYLLRGDVHETANVGVALIDTSSLQMGAGSRIGHLTIVRNLEQLTLGEDARIGTFNWIFGARNSSHFNDEIERASILKMCKGASVTSRHILDCSDTIEIGTYATLAGFRSQILTHAIDFNRNRQSCAPVRIGEFSFIGTGAIILKGAQFPPYSVLSAGSVYSSRGGEKYRVYSGVPAVISREISKDAEYMNRSVSHVT